MVDSVSVRFTLACRKNAFKNIRIQWNAGTACVSRCVLKTLACRGLRVGPSKPRNGAIPPPLPLSFIPWQHKADVYHAEACTEVQENMHKPPQDRASSQCSVQLCNVKQWLHLVSHRHICAISHFATCRAISVRHPMKTSTK